MITTKTINETGDSTYPDFYALVRTSDGGFAVTGSLNDRMAMLKFDNSLNLQWHKEFTSLLSDYSYGDKLIQTSDGGYLVAGTLHTADSSDKYFGYLVKTDNEGSVLWSKQFSGYDEIADIVSTNDSNYAFITFSGAALVKISSSGNIIWSKSVSIDSGYDTKSISLLPDFGGNLVVCGSISKNIVSPSQIFLLKFSQNGTLIWSKTSDNGDNYSVYINDIIEDNDSSYIIAGGKYGVNADKDMSYVLKVGRNGTLQWTKAFSLPNSDEYINSIIRTNDGGYAACGEIYYGNFERASVYKFNSNFGICGDMDKFGNLTDLTVRDSSSNPFVLDSSTFTPGNNLTVAAAGAGIYLCGALPLPLLSFNATLQNKSVNVQWTTANEINTDHFIVERSTNSSDFKQLQQVKATVSNSGTQTYQVTDRQPLWGTSYYRLQQVDKDGSFAYSAVVPVMVTTNGAVVISPNPVHYNLHVLLQSNTSEKITLQVIDITGKLLRTQQANIIAGTNTITIPAAALSKGIYVLEVIQKNKVQSVKFVKE